LNPSANFLIEGVFHVTLGIVSPKILFNVLLREIDFLFFKNSGWIQTSPLPMWRLVIRIQICASLNHLKKKKAESSRLIPGKLTANL